MTKTEIRNVAVIGAGTMGQGIAQNFAQSGLNVWLIENVDKDLLACQMSQVEANLKLFHEFGLLKEAVAKIKSRIHPALMKDLNGIAPNCEFIIESIPESLGLKRQLFAHLDSCASDTILASNTSSLTIQAIAVGLKTAYRLIGTHYFNPAHIIPLVEIHCGPATSKDVIDATKALLEKAGKKTILVRKHIPGLVVNRLNAAMSREIFYLVDMGVVTPKEIDIAAKASYGFRSACIGTIEGYDMIGLDVLEAVRKEMFGTLYNGIEQPAITERVKRGELGVKSGKGFYDYAGKTRAQILDTQNRKMLRQLVLFSQAMEAEQV